MGIRIKSILGISIFLASIHVFGQTDSVERHHSGTKFPVDQDSLMVFPGSVKAAANPELKAKGFKTLLLGKNYRTEWITPVTAPVLNFKKQFGGLDVKKKGGGKETRSIRVDDSLGREWALRSVRK